MGATTARRLPPALQIEANAKISALLSDLELKAYYLSDDDNIIIASTLQSTSFFNNLANMTPIAQNIAIFSPLQTTSFNNDLINITPTSSSNKPVDFSNRHQNRSTANCTTDTSIFGDEIEIFGIDNNYYTF